MTTRRTPIRSGWTYAQLPSPSFPDLTPDSKECQFAAVSKFPTSVHVELLKAGRIEDPYKDLNEADVQWINEADWSFKTTFNAPKLLSHTDLVFEGLDTYATVLLNGHEILRSSNMFVSHRVDVSASLRHGGANTLELRFDAPFLSAEKEQAANGGPRPLWNGDSSRLYARKAQYGWGWDWGPIVMTVGPWKDVVLETYDYRIDNLRIDADVRKGAPLDVSGEVVGNPVDGEYEECTLVVAGFDVLPAPPETDYKTVYTLTDSTGSVVKQLTSPPGQLPKWDLGTDVDVWYPINYGDQPLYALEVALVDAKGTTLATTSQRVAFRHVEVVQDPLPDSSGGGSTFLFEVNGIRIFCGGSNWIPADNYLTEISVERYRAWIELLIKGNQNMVRVWGGGIYEAEALYDICDERGVLVWQDFLFGCGIYPSYPALNDSVKVEAEQAVARLRAHPSVVIFAGNNEDYQIAETEGVVDYDDHSGDYMHTKFPARHIYEILLPEVVHRLSNIFYWPSSPYGGKTSGDLTVGDVHQWNVWHGTQEPWANWDILAGRFVSEFGMQGYPNLRTVREWFSTKDLFDKEGFPQSRISVNHNKALGFERRLELYLMENFRHAFDMPSYVYYTQAMQAETLAAAYRLWRRNWGGRGKELTAGALVWQINDCWPCVSWAICDYYLRPKPAFYAIARELRPYTVGMARKEIKTPRNSDSLAFYTIRHEIQLWGTNSTLTAKRSRIELVSFDLEQGEVDRRFFAVELAPNSSTEVWKGDVPGQPVRTSTSQVPRPIVVQARLIDEDGFVLARYSNWPEPWKYLTFPDPNLQISVDGDDVTVTVDKPVKGLILDTELDDDDGGGKECYWSDQALDMFPGDPQVVTAEGLKGRKVTARYIGDGSA